MPNVDDHYLGRVEYLRHHTLRIFASMLKLVHCNGWNVWLIGLGLISYKRDILYLTLKCRNDNRRQTQRQWTSRQKILNFASSQTPRQVYASTTPNCCNCTPVSRSSKPKVANYCWTPMSNDCEWAQWWCCPGARTISVHEPSVLLLEWMFLATAGSRIQMRLCVPPNLLFGKIWISCFQIPCHSIMRLVSRHPYLVCPLNFSVCLVIVILLVFIQLEIIDLMNIIIRPITS